ncbi:hypothetical protein OG304_06605 [Streptomyces sp. NBC_00160]|uniref:hypothetical protein n=1 Tax=Streptomyces sp. NBC_00160 TaxID=2903628 RepID=UPI0022572EF7|nr:hypothetical protein [Streptomyces sp. NBC_00160]MCX5303122.1 hypothetical protein [Streptomyces sp. NBC_00160]
MTAPVIGGVDFGDSLPALSAVTVKTGASPAVYRVTVVAGPGGHYVPEESPGTPAGSDRLR